MDPAEVESHSLLTPHPPSSQFDTAETRPEIPDRSMLPPGKMESYVAPASASEPLASLLASEQPRDSFQETANRAFRAGMGLGAE